MLPDYRVRQPHELPAINRLISEELDLAKVLARILRAASQLLSSHASLIALRGDGGGWRLAASYGIRQEFLRELDPLLSDIPDQGDPARFALPEVNRRLQRITRAATMGLLNGVGLPMIARGRVAGVIFVFRSYEGTYSAEDRSLLQAFASQAAIAVNNASLYTEVHRQNQYLDAVLESSADGILLLDPQHRILRFHPARGGPTASSADPRRTFCAGCAASPGSPWNRRRPTAGRFHPRRPSTSRATCFDAKAAGGASASPTPPSSLRR